MFLPSLQVCAIAATCFTATACVADELSDDLLRPKGSYICTVEQKAGIASEMLEGGPPPTAFIAKDVTRFRILVSPRVGDTSAARFKVEEQPLTVADRDARMAVGEGNLLRGVYLGDGWRFTAAEDQAFLRLDMANVDSGWLWFYHAGFEKLDVDHVNLSVRSGTCAPASSSGTD
jgi:hypothetical protein